MKPQARIAHQPRHASKALNSPIRIKIVASTLACGIKQAPVRRKTAAIPPRAARPLLSMFGFIRMMRVYGCGRKIDRRVSLASDTIKH